MRSRYFLDESGHGGDLVTSNALDFAGQPTFALACIGPTDENALADELERIRSKHRCGDGELKSSSLGDKLPAVASELIEWLIDHDAAHFVELIGKRYFVAIHVVNHLLCGRYCLDEVDQMTRCALAELLDRNDFAGVLIDYMAACRSQSLGDVSATLDALWEALDRSDEDIARIGQLLTMYARDETQRAGADATRYLPIADQSVTGKSVWILPNLQCLTNVYGRINQSRRNLSGVTLVHDEQLQYGKVLGDAKSIMERLAAEDALPLMPFADYRLRGSAMLAFATSADEPCLQAADILAGTAMRFSRSAFGRKAKADAALREPFTALFNAGNPFQATGINLVMSDRALDRLGVPHIPAAPFVRHPSTGDAGSR